MGSHIVNGKFQSDKYPTCPAGKVPLSVEDPMAQDLLCEYSRRRRGVDAEFSEDLQTALANAGFHLPCTCGADAVQPISGRQIVGHWEACPARQRIK